MKSLKTNTKGSRGQDLAIVELRRFLGISQLQLASFLGVSRSAIAQVEAGNKPLAPKALERYYHLLENMLEARAHSQPYVPENKSVALRKAMAKKKRDTLKRELLNMEKSLSAIQNKYSKAGLRYSLCNVISLDIPGTTSKQRNRFRGQLAGTQMNIILRNDLASQFELHLKTVGLRAMIAEAEKMM